MDNFSLPLIDDCMDSLYGKKLFSVLDLCSGYFQIPVEESSRHKTSFKTRFIVYLDDIIVLGTDFQDIIGALRKIFIRFRTHNLKFKPRKCQFFKSQVEFLGKLVSGSGIAISPDKVEAVKQWPVPSNAKELFSFLGFMNYQRNHIQNFAKVSADLYELAHAKLYVWTGKHQSSFEALKELALSAQVLSHPSPDGLFILDTDASDKQIGVELSQIQNRVERPICFASHVLMKQHKNYCTTRKELLSIVKFCRQFRHYLLGWFYIIQTDHNSLVWLTRFKHLEGQLARFMKELSQYNFKIVHQRGAEHNSADALSQIEDNLAPCDCYRAGTRIEDLPCGGCHYCSKVHRQWARFYDDVDDVVPLAVRSVRAGLAEQASSGANPVSNLVVGLSSLQLREAQQNDSSLGAITHWLEYSYEPSKRELLFCSPETRSLWLMRDQLSLDQVYYFTPGNELTPCQHASLCHPTYSPKYCITVIIQRILDIWVNKRPSINLRKDSISMECPETVICTSNSVLFVIPI